MHLACFDMYLKSSADKLRRSDSVLLRLTNASGKERAFLTGRVTCPCTECEAQPFGDAVVARTVSEETFELYLDSRSLANNAQKVETALQAVVQLEGGEGGETWIGITRGM